MNTYCDMKVPALLEIVGGLSKPSKMPGFSYSLPALECGVGTRLRSVADSVCEGCYAMTGAYRFPGTKTAMYRRLSALADPRWVGAMSELINRKAARHPHFRWHDSGDLQSVEHLQQIVAVANATPTVRHWLPTREYRIVTDYVTAGHAIPANMNIRLSAHMIGGHVPTFPRLAGVAGITVSTVSRNDSTYPNAHACPSRHQDNQCGDCRACWSPDVAHVDYHLH